METTANHLIDTLYLVLPLLNEISEERASVRPGAGKWSPKELIGHLIDSACNNQQKFVRCIVGPGADVIAYQQDDWVNVQRYNNEPWQKLLVLWEHYNYHIAHIIRNIPPAALQHSISISGKGPFTLEFIARDYGEHLKHHLKSLFPEADFLANSFKMIY